MVSAHNGVERVSLSPYREPAEVKANLYMVGTAEISINRTKDYIDYNINFIARWFPEYTYYYSGDGARVYTEPLEVEDIKFITNNWIIEHYKMGLFRLKSPFTINGISYSKDELYIPSDSINKISVEFGTKNAEPEKQPLTLEKNRVVLSVK